MIDTNNSKIGNPFPFRVFCQKVIPLAFDESMSYLELLYSLLHYLKETVIPAVNNNADAVTELQNLYNELKSYVDNYFENLDIQTEINNKLDEMAESGKLTDIIAQYLQLAGVLAFNTKNDLKNAENLNNGSITRILGTNIYNDGYGAYYKIRNILNTDVIDDDDIITLTNYPNLIGEKIPNNYINDLNNTITNTNNEINKIKTNLNLMSIKEKIYQSPLLVMKQKIAGTTGDTASYQSIAVKYNSNGVPEKIFILANYNTNTYARLYIVSCGERTNGTEWTYTYTDSIPNTHGSSMTYKDGSLYIADIGYNTIIKFNVSTYEYESINLSSLFENNNQYIVGVAYDEITDTFLLCGNDNTYMFVVNNDFTQILRSYTHDFNITGDYVEQTFDFYDNIEMRCVSTSINNIILFIDTFTGQVLKTSTIESVNGEIESISYKKGYITILFNGFNPALDGISMSAVTEAFIGGYNGNDYYKLFQNRPLIDNIFALNNNAFQYYPTYYFQNNNSNDNLVRYVGMGTQSNPFKSSLAMFSHIIGMPYIKDFRVTINILPSTNSDDSFIKFTGDSNIQSLVINGNSNALKGFLNVTNLDAFFEINNVVIQAGNTRRTNGEMYIYENSNIVVRNSNSAVTCLIHANRMIRSPGTISTTGSNNIQRNVFTEGNSSKFSGSPLTFSNNITL